MALAELGSDGEAGRHSTDADVLGRDVGLAGGAARLAVCAGESVATAASLVTIVAVAVAVAGAVGLAVVASTGLFARNVALAIEAIATVAAVAMRTRPWL